MLSLQGLEVADTVTMQQALDKGYSIRYAVDHGGELRHESSSPEMGAGNFRQRIADNTWMWRQLAASKRNRLA